MCDLTQWAMNKTLGEVLKEMDGAIKQSLGQLEQAAATDLARAQYALSIINAAEGRQSEQQRQQSAYHDSLYAALTQSQMMRNRRDL